MEKEYYIVVDDDRIGPLSIAQLSERGIEPSTLVWTSGLADWTRADCIPELSILLANRIHVDNQESAFGVYTQKEEYGQRPWQQQQQQQQQSYGAYNGVNPNRMNSYQPQSSVNWKTLSIVATICGFLFSCIGGIIGIFAILQANNAENAMRMGDDLTAQNNWSTCKTLTIISFVLTGLGLIANIAFLSNMKELISLGLYQG